MMNFITLAIDIFAASGSMMPPIAAWLLCDTKP